MTSFQAIPDPFPGKGPIPVGGSGFYKRVETLAIIQDLLQAGNSVSLVGERKAGKTSFLKYLVANLASDKFIPVFLDAQRIMPQTNQTFLGSLLNSAAQAIAKTKDIKDRYTPGGESSQDFLKNLHAMLDQHFSAQDLRTLCFYLGVDYDNLPSGGKINKARELIIHLQRRNRLPDLIKIGRQVRPDIQWEDTPNDFQKIIRVTNPLKVTIFDVKPDQIYRTFEQDLERFRQELPKTPGGEPYRLVWLIDEIELLEGFQEGELFVFLRPFAQSDPNFRMLVAGYDVLYTLSTRSKWSPFYNAFQHIRLIGLNPIVAQQVIDDGCATMNTTIEQNLYLEIFQWTGQKPFFLKWTLSQIAHALNERANGYHIDTQVLEDAKILFLGEKDIDLVFMHLWNTHTTPRQQLVLSLMACSSFLSTHIQILDQLKEKKFVQASSQAAQDLVDDLKRLEQLGFLYESMPKYEFTSGCLRAWIAKNKPL